MTRSLKLSAIVSLVAYASGAAALLWRRTPSTDGGYARRKMRTSSLS